MSATTQPKPVVAAARDATRSGDTRAGVRPDVHTSFVVTPSNRSTPLRDPHVVRVGVLMWEAESSLGERCW